MEVGGNMGKECKRIDGMAVQQCSSEHQQSRVV